METWASVPVQHWLILRPRDFNIAIPELPYISGRELAGEVVYAGSKSGRFKIGENVIVISTDYRDIRKAAYQEFVVCSEFNAVKMPPPLPFEAGAALGVEFVTAALALGVCMGVNFSHILDGPDFSKLVGANTQSLPEDIRQECIDARNASTSLRSGEWLVIWGGSSTSANMTTQLAKLAGLRVALVVDIAKHGLRLSNHKTIRPDLVVDSHDSERAVHILLANCGHAVRLGLDTSGSRTASSLLQALGSINTNESSSTTSGLAHGPNHLVCLAGVPKQPQPWNTTFHVVPMKLFHEVPKIGEAMVLWLERLLRANMITPPEIFGIEDGMENVNKGLDRMRRWEVSGGKLVVRIAQHHS